MMENYIGKSINKYENTLKELSIAQEIINESDNKLSFWLNNSRVFEFIDDKEGLLRSLVMSSNKIENVRVEKGENEPGYYFICPLGEFLYLDLENKTYDRKIGFLKKDYWVEGKEQFERDMEKCKNLLYDLDNFKKLTVLGKLKTNRLFKQYKKTDGGIEDLRRWVNSEDKIRSLYIMRKQISEDVNKLMDELDQLMKENDYELKHNYR